MPVPIAELFVTVGADISGLTTGLNAASANVTKFGNSLQGVGADLTKGLTVPIVGAAAIIGKTGADFEHAFTQVRKTVDLSGQELDDFRKGLLDLSTTEAGGGKSANELAQIAAVAGQLGIDGAPALLDFTKTVAQLSVTTGIATGEISDGLARVAVLTGTFKTGEISNVGSAITALGNEMAGSEKDIIDIATRSAGALHSLGASAPDILGLSSAVSAIGVNPEAGGSSLQRLFLDIGNAVAGTAKQTPDASKKIQDLKDKITDLGNSLAVAEERQTQFGRNTPAATVKANADAIDKYKRELGQAQTELAKVSSTAGGGTGVLGAFAQAAGLNVDEFKALFKENPVKGFQAIVNGLHNIAAEKGPDALVQSLKAMGVNDVRDIQLLIGLAQSADQLDKALNVANSSFADNTATQNEVAKAMQDTENQFALLQNQLKRIAIDAWPAFRDAAMQAMDVIRTTVIPFLQNLSAQWQALSPNVQQGIIIFLAIAAALGPVIIAVGAFVAALGAIIGVAGVVFSAIGSIGVVLAILLSPIGLIIAAVALLAAAWATNFGDIQGKTEVAIRLIAALFQFLQANVFPVVGKALIDAFSAISTVLGPVKDFVGQVISLFGSVALFTVTVWLTALRTIAGFFSSVLLPAIQSVGGWVADHIGGALLAVLQFIGGVAASLGITNVGGFDIGQAITSAQQALAAASTNVATAGAGGNANDIVVNINNPSVPNQGAADALAQQVQDVIITLLVGSEASATPPPGPPANFVPGGQF